MLNSQSACFPSIYTEKTNENRRMARQETPGEVRECLDALLAIKAKMTGLQESM